MTEMILNRPIACFDIEATGINPHSDRMVELAIVRMHPDGSQDSHRFVINPGIPIPIEASNIHGFKDDYVRDCPPFTDIASDVNAILENCDLSGFNLLRYDIPMLVAEMARADIRFELKNRKVVDAQRIFHQQEPRDLTAAIAYYCNEMHLGAHGAMADVTATMRVIESQLKRYSNLPRDVPSLDLYCNPRDPSWVDRSGRLKWINKTVAINFGKKKGVALETLIKDDPGFIKWMLKSDFPPDVKEIVAQGQRGEWPEPPSAASP